MKEGQAVVSHDIWTIIKVLDLRLIYEQLELNIDNYVKLREHVQSCFNYKAFDSDFIEVESQTEYAMNITIEKYKQLVPSLIRTKRGLLNPLGSLVKMITGNLDNDDALEYERLMNKLKTKQDRIARKITIVAEMLGKLTDITNTTRNNFIQIDEALKEIDHSFNESKLFQTSNKIIHMYNTLTNNFQTLYIRLDEIETALVFARIKLLHPSIVDTDELISLLQEIEKSAKLVYNANIENILKIEQCIEIKAYVKQNQIKFIMQIPLIRNDIFNYYKLIPLPIYNNTNSLTTLILPKYPYLLVKGLYTKSLSQPCREIEESRFLCFENDASLLIKDECITALVQFSTNVSSCHPVPVIIDDVKADLIQPNRWVVYAKTETLITKYCDSEIMQENICGTYLLTLDDDCQLKIKDLNFKRQQFQGKDVFYTRLPIFNLPRMVTRESDAQRRPVHLNGVDLVNIQQLNNLLQESESEITSESEMYYQFKSFYIGNIAFYIIIITFFVFLAYKYNIHKICVKDVTQDNPHNSDNLELTEGGVISPLSSSRPILLSP